MNETPRHPKTTVLQVLKEALGLLFAALVFVVFLALLADFWMYP